MSLTPPPVRWFGLAPFSDACRVNPKAETPVGRTCAWCDEAFTAADEGYIVPALCIRVDVDSHSVDDVSGHVLPFHTDCLLRQTTGGVAHVMERCACFGGTDEGDPPELTVRQAASLAVRIFEARRGAEPYSVEGEMTASTCVPAPGSTLVH